MNSENVLGIIAAIIIVIALFEMLRRNRLREKYAVVWFVIALCAIGAALFPSLVAALADLVGIKLPANLLFFLASLVLLAVSLQHSHELGRLEEKTRTLAEEAALLRERIARLEEDASAQNRAQPGTSLRPDDQPR